MSNCTTDVLAARCSKRSKFMNKKMGYEQKVLIIH